MSTISSLGRVSASFKVIKAIPYTFFNFTSQIPIATRTKIAPIVIRTKLNGTGLAKSTI